MVMNKQIGKIGGKIYLYMFVSAMIVLIMISGFEIIDGYMKERKNIESIREEMADSISKEVLNTIQQIERAMFLTVHSKGVLEQGLSERFKFYLLKLMKNYATIFDLSAIDSNGNEIVIASKMRTTTSYDLVNRRSEEFFIKSIKGEVYHGDIFYKYGSKPFLTISVPIALFGGKHIGVLSADVNIMDLQKLISDKKVGKKGYAYLVDKQGFIIAHPSLSLTFSQTNVLGLKIIKKVFAEPEKIHHDIYKNPEGKNVLASSKFIKEIGWVLVLDQTTEEAFAHVYSSIYLFLTGLGIVFIMISLLTYSFSKKIVKPIMILHDAAEKIGAGDLNTSINIKTGDEIEELGDTFNTMTIQLKELFNSLENKVEERTRDISLRFSFASAITRSLEKGEILKAGGKELISGLALDGFAVSLQEEESRITSSYHAFISEEIFQDLINIVFEKGWTKNVLQEKRPFILNLSKEYYDLPINEELMGIQSLGLFPILYMDEALGVMILFSKKEDVFKEEIISLIGNTLLGLGVTISNAKLHEKTKELSLTDPLTKLANRRLFEIKINDEFLRYRRYNQGISLVMLDIDHFKKVNDTYGHQAGDRILEQIGNMVYSSIRKIDTAARFGGEEFAILLPETNREQAFITAERLRGIVENHSFKIDVPPYEIKLTISLGIAESKPDMKNWEELMGRADIALYKAKNAGRNRVC